MTATAIIRATVVILMLSFGQLAAQTFEKIIRTDNFSIGVPYISIDNSSNTYITALSTLALNSSLRFSQQSFLFKLNERGDVVLQKEILPSDLDSNWQDSLNHILITSQELAGDSILLTGSIRTNQPTQFSAIQIKMNKNLQFGSSKTFLPQQDSFPAFYGYLNKEYKKLNYGYRQNINIDVSLGIISLFDRNGYREISLFSDIKQMWSGAVQELLKDKQTNFYSFSTEYSGPPFFSIEGPTIIKLDSNLNFRGRSRLTVPLRHSGEINNLVFAGINSQWISDSTFVVAIAQSNNIDTSKGDLHLFVYDTALTRINYKRFVTTDTNIVSQPNTLRYDSVTGGFYLATLQTIDPSADLFREAKPSTYRLIRFDKNLNVVWDKQYNNGATISLDVMEVDQYGQITMAGGYEDSTTRANGNTRNIYVLRVDSNGNFIRTDLLDKTIPMRNYMVYPNPASTNVTFKKFNRFEPYNVEIFDQVGRRVGEFDWLENERSHSVENLHPGIYIYKITDKEGITSSGKLVKADL